MKKLLVASALAVVLGSIAIPMAFAKEGAPGQEKKQLHEQIKHERQEFRQEVKDERKEFHQEVKEAKKEFKLDLKDLFKNKRASDEAKHKGKAAHLIGATVTAVNTSSLTVSKDGKSYTVNTSSQTKFRRHFWGKSNLSEFSVGDKVNVWGKWIDDNKTVLDAHMIRNLSIMKRHGVFFGTILSLGSNSFVIKSINRGDQTVALSVDTKIEDRRGKTLLAADLKVGHKVRVKGLWDKANSKITDVKQVKDFSLPTKEKVSPTPSVTVTGTVTPTVTVTTTSTPTPTP